VAGPEAGADAARSPTVPIEIELGRVKLGHDYPSPQTMERLGEAPRAGHNVEHPVTGPDVALEQGRVQGQGYTISQGAVEPLPFFGAECIEVRGDRRGVIRHVASARITSLAFVVSGGPGTRARSRIPSNAQIYFASV